MELVWTLSDCFARLTRLTRFASLRVAIESIRDERASTRSTQDVTNNMGTLRVTVDNDVGARALSIEGSDLGDAVAGSLSNLVAVGSTESDVELDVDVVTALTLGGEFAAGCLDEGESAAIMVRRIISTGHEDDYIGTRSIELRRSLSGGEGGQSAQGESISDTERRHDYRLWWRCLYTTTTTVGKRPQVGMGY